MHKMVYMRHWRLLWNDKTWYHLNIYKLRPPANPVTISKGVAHISARVGSKRFVFYIQVPTKKSQKWLQQLSFVLTLFSTKEIKNIKILENHRYIIFNTKNRIEFILLNPVFALFPFSLKFIIWIRRNKKADFYLQ